MEHNHQLWAEQQWGTCALGDIRRTRRAVLIGQQMAAHPDWSLPQQMGDSAALAGAYRLLNNRRVSAATLLKPHQAATLAECARLPVALLIQDRTTLDYTSHQATTSLGAIGGLEYPHGFFLHSTLAVNPDGRQIIGLAHTQCLVRPEQPAKHPANRRESAEGQAWETAVAAIGPVPAGTKWVYVSDRESDIYEYLLACRRQGAGFVTRMYQNRSLENTEPDEAGLLLDAARQWPAVPGSTYTVTVAETKKSPKRTATICLSWHTVTLRAPRYLKNTAPLTVTIVRAWEPEPPPDAEAVEWILATSESVRTLADAQRVVHWYECRWLVEDFHQCLKTGCRVEDSQLDDGLDLQRLLGFAAPIAVRLLHLRQIVRIAPDSPAQTVIEPQRIKLLAAHYNRPPQMTVAEFWKLVARLGGHQGRKSDGMPGWRTLWRGWLRLDQWFYAMQLLR